ncbi:hypothetical protein H6G81_18970 [Scytonema hofmannii FACHB-248]|uniref:Uncharacterized protein n=1 Tax=Scytonema hofmannii FACHB-248 TaxID=1842502 RepID=A0ABR8GT17_9CYAN|nr:MULTISPECIES: hypothetical protein [Nostocales]MBD2606555.1 hypothetical protein [Scytonema hofmannii FACHB-248]
MFLLGIRISVTVTEFLVFTLGAIAIADHNFRPNEWRLGTQSARVGI